MKPVHRLQEPLQLPLPTPRRRRGGTGPIERGSHHTVVGLFAGVGGIERGLHRAGHETVLLCENDPAAVAVLEHHFSGVVVHRDVRDLHALPEGTTLVAGGFPCQDLSQAGKTAGIGGERSGLVGEVFRLIAAHRTPWVLLENVPFMLQLGRGHAMDRVAAGFESLGYKWAYRVVDSRSFGVPQRRRRVYFLAALDGDPRTVLFADEAGARDTGAVDESLVACGFYWTEGIRGLGWAVDAVPTLKGGSTIGIPSSPAILLPNGRVVVPDIRDAERMQGFPANWTKAAETVSRAGARWKLVGNAVTVRATEWLGRRMAHPGLVREFPLARLRECQWPSAAWNMGDGRFGVAASEWPVRRKHQSLEEFLRFPPKPLSLKATNGFLARTERSTLHFPDRLLDSLRTHARMLDAATSDARNDTPSLRSRERLSA